MTTMQESLDALRAATRELGRNIWADRWPLLIIIGLLEALLIIIVISGGMR